MIFDILDILDDLPAFDPSPRYRGERRNLMAKWTLGLALAGIITIGLTSLASLVTGIIAFVQIAATGQRGLGTAISGFVIGLLVTAAWAAVAVAAVAHLLGS